MNKGTLRQIVAVLLVASLGFFPVDVASHAASISLSAFAPTPPIIDGSVGSEEWSFAAKLSFSIGGTSGNTIYIMNDNLNVYIALTINDADLTDNDGLRVSFDNNHNGVSETDEDVLFLSKQGFSDQHFVAPSDFSNAGEAQNGAGKASRQGSLNHFEFLHPLCSRDPSDFCLRLGDTVGFSVFYSNNGAPPQGGLGTLEDASGWGDMAMAKLAIPGFQPEAILVALLLAATFLFYRGKGRSRDRLSKENCER